MHESVDSYDEFENALMDLLTEPDRFLERRLRLRAARARVNHFHGRYWQAVQRAFFGLRLARTVRPITRARNSLIPARSLIRKRSRKN
jgi:hypothetical protein